MTLGKRPKWFTPMLRLGYIDNIAGTIISITYLVIGIVNPSSSDITALDFMNSVSMLPIYVYGLTICHLLKKKNILALQRLKYYTYISIIMSVSHSVAEARFALDASTSGGVDLMFSGFGIMVMVAILLFWDRPVIRSYLIEPLS